MAKNTPYIKENNSVTDTIKALYRLERRRIDRTPLVPIGPNDLPTVARVLLELGYSAN